MTEENQDFSIYEGDSVRIEATVINEANNPIDISNHTAQFVLADFGGSEPIVEYSDDDDAVTYTDPSGGDITIELDQDDTDGLAEYDTEEYYYEIELTDEERVLTHTVTTGTITVKSSY